MKLSQFDDLAGDTPLDKCATLLAKSTDGIVYAQEKINGVSLRATYDAGVVTCTTRNAKVWASNFFNVQFYAELRDMLQHMPPGTALLGELHVHNELLATIAGWVSVKSPKANEEFLRRGRLVIWDCITPDCRTFGGRMQLIRHAQQHETLYVQVSDTGMFQNATPKALELWYQQVLKEKGEGVVYRVDPCFQYEDNTPSPHAWKRTPTYSIEGTCIAVARGMGKRRDLLGAMYIKLQNGITVAAGGGAGLNDALLAKYLANPPLGKLVTISYKELSIKGTPLRPQIVAVRDYE